MLLVQFLVLAFTGVVWWLARRDLGSRLAPPVPAPPADTRELEQLCATLEALVTHLAGRLEAVEQRLQENVGALQNVGVPPAAPSSSGVPMGVGTASSAPTRLSFVASSPDVTVAEPEAASHAALYALLDEGVTDPAEIARRTGLGPGEVDLILNLRARRAL